VYVIAASPFVTYFGKLGMVRECKMNFVGPTFSSKITFRDDKIPKESLFIALL